MVAKQSLVVDDGGRNNNPSPAQRTEFEIHQYYEIDRIAACIRQKNYTRIALQFPDHLLPDAPIVVQQLQSQLVDSSSCLVFCLGDTTYASCCPDSIAAAHLQADVLVHYGHACLSELSSCSQSNRLPVLYSFGQVPLSEQCLSVLQERIRNDNVSKLLILYDLKYRGSVQELAKTLSEQFLDIVVATGDLPDIDTEEVESSPKEEVLTTEDACCGADSSCGRRSIATTATTGKPDNWEDADAKELLRSSVGGLHIEPSVLSNIQDYTLLYLGDEASSQFLNIVLRFLSLSNPPREFWTYCEKENILSTTVSPRFQKLLNQRFYKVQKARECRVFGILVAQMTATATRLVNGIRNLLADADRDSYTFCVGKLNEAKLANFPEIDCFVLVACPEHSLLHKLDYPVPILTPLELLMSLEIVEWPGRDASYSTQAADFFASMQEDSRRSIQNDDTDSDHDAPHFSLVTGGYIGRTSSKVATAPVSAATSTTDGTLIQYKSAAANFLQSREFRGLSDHNVPVQAAVPGQTGIASKYKREEDSKER